MGFAAAIGFVLYNTPGRVWVMRLGLGLGLGLGLVSVGWNNYNYTPSEPLPTFFYPTHVLSV